MSPLSITCFLFFLILFLTLFRKGTDIFSPARLFMLIWTLAIGVTDLKLSWFQTSWTTYSWIMLCIAMLSMLVGMFVVYVINADKTIKDLSIVRNETRRLKIDSNKLFRYAFWLFTTYLVSFLVSYLAIGFLPILTINPAVTKNEWGIFGFGLLVQSFPTVFYFIVLYLIVEKKHWKRKAVLSVFLLVAFLSYTSLLQRYYVILAIMLVVVTSYYFTNFFRFRNVLLIMGILFLVFWGFSQIRLSAVAVNILYYLSDMKYSVKYAAFTEPYMYMAMNLENFAHAVTKLDKFTYGIFSFDFVFALSGFKHLLREYLVATEYPYLITNNYNTYTMFFVIYRDFGILGLGIVPFGFGMMFSNAYYRLRKLPNIHTISVYSICTFVIVLSFFVPIFTYLNFVFNLFLIYFLTKSLLSEDTGFK